MDYAYRIRQCDNGDYLISAAVRFTEAEYKYAQRKSSLPDDAELSDVRKWFEKSGIAAGFQKLAVFLHCIEWSGYEYRKRR